MSFDHDGYGHGPLPLEITSHSDNAVVEADCAFDIRGRTGRMQLGAGGIGRQRWRVCSA
jgi:hypothetical protein